MTPRRFVPLRAVVVVVVALLLQIAFVADLRVAGAVGDLLLVVVVAAGLTGGAERGAFYGFGAGVAYDLVLDTPFGLSALTYALVGYAVGLLVLVIPRTSGWWPVSVAAVAGLVQAALYTSVGNLIGVPYPFGDVPTVGLVMAVAAALAVLPAMRVLWWVHGQPEVDRLEVMFR